MYICNCNGLTERQVKAAVDAGARSHAEVLAHYGHEPQCGTCRDDIAWYIARAEATDAGKDAPGLLPAVSFANP